MKNQYNMRKAQLKDVENVLNLYNELIDELNKGINYPDWTKNYYPDYNYLKEKAEKEELFLLENNNQLVGSTVLNADRIEDYKKIPWEKEFADSEILTIHTFAIKNDLRGNHLGEKFIKLIEDYAKKMNFKVIRLDTIYGNIPAIHFYSNVGFNNLGEYQLHYEETDESRFYLFEKYLY